MSDDDGGKTEDKDQQIDVNALVDSVKNKVSEQLDGKFEDFTKELSETVKNASKIDTDNDDLDDDNDDDAVIMTKADLKKLRSDLQDDIRKTTNDVLNENSNKSSRDAQALETFPMLNKKAKEFSKEFYDATLRVWDRREKEGVDANNPNIMYDSVA